MVAQQKLLRVFRLIRMLTQKGGKSIDELAMTLDITRRSVYRYLELLESIGYLIDKDLDGRYFLFIPVHEELPNQFLPEETDLLRQLIQAGAPNDIMRDGLLRKLYLNTDLLPMADHIHQAQAARVVQLLSEAITDRVQARLINYYSASRGTANDRLVEPLQFTDNFRMLVAYEVESQEIKHFKIDRIPDVELLGDKQSQHQVPSGPDIFGMSGKKHIDVELSLSPLAYRLLVEEFPATRPFVEEDPSLRLPFRFLGQIRSYVGIGRFILGLPGEIEVLGPKGLTSYLKKQNKKHIW
jgi:predicted DNA-binding transcriptional regulator YafY